METRTASFKPAWISSRAYLRQNLPRQTNWTSLSSTIIAAAKRFGPWGKNINGNGRLLISMTLRCFPPEISIFRSFILDDTVSQETF